jgi:hypothetical protein
MTALMTWLPLIVLVGFVAAFVVAAWSPRIGRARDRLALVVDGLLAAGLLVAGRGIVDWSTTSIYAWYALVVLLAAGVAGAVLRWSALPALTDPAKRTSRTWGAGFTLAILAVLVGVTTV